MVILIFLEQLCFTKQQMKPCCCPLTRLKTSSCSYVHRWRYSLWSRDGWMFQRTLPQCESLQVLVSKLGFYLSTWSICMASRGFRPPSFKCCHCESLTWTRIKNSRHYHLCFKCKPIWLRSWCTLYMHMVVTFQWHCKKNSWIYYSLWLQWDQSL